MLWTCATMAAIVRPLLPGQFGAPCGGIEMLEDDLIHPLVDGVTLHQHLARVDANVSL
jgi:hypothetical protein